MKHILRKAIAAVVISLALNDCKEPSPYVITCVDGLVPYQLAGSKNQSFTIKNDNPNLVERAIVIQSDIEYNTYMDQSSFGAAPQVDFNSKTMLVGRFSSLYSTGFLSQEVISDCKSNTLNYNVTLYKKADGSFGNTSYYAVIPKIAETTKVHFNIIIND